MNSFFSGLLSLLTGGISKVFQGSGGSVWDNLGNAMSNWGNSLSDLSNQNPIGNASAKYLGTRLTDAEREANAFTASEAEKNRQFQQQSADIAWQREMEADSTIYQRRVADMQAAGLNPMLAAGGIVGNSVSAASASGSAGSSVSPSSGGNLGSLLSLMLQSKMLPAQLANIAADTATKEATASKIAEETRGTKLQNDYFDVVKGLRADGEALANGLSRAKISQVEKSLDEIDANINHLKESASTESSKRELNMAQSLLARANARQIVELLPYEKAYKSASTEEARAAALLSTANAAYQNGLINDGYLDAIISSAKASAESAESKAELDNIKAAIRTGDYSKVHHRYGLASDCLSVFAILLDNFNPLGSIFK